MTPRHLNKHINYASCCAPAPNAESQKSLALPQGMAVTADGTKLYVAALGSSKIGVYGTTALETDTFVPDTKNQIPVTGGGPTGLVLNPTAPASSCSRGSTTPSPSSAPRRARR